MPKAKYTLTEAAAKRIWDSFHNKIQESCGFGLVRALDEAIRDEGLKAHDRRALVIRWMADNNRSAFVTQLAAELSRELDNAHERLRKVADSCQSVINEVNQME